MLVSASEYTVVAEARGQEVLWFRRFGSYQGEWLLLSRDERLYYVYKDWYGSCSGCDAIEGSNLSGEMDAADPQLVEFIESYRPFLEMEHWSALEVANRDGNLLAVIPANMQGSDFSSEEVGRQLALTVKHDAGEIGALEILELDNMETRRAAIEKYGATAWAFDAEAVVIDEEGPNQLMRILRAEQEDYHFLHLKDGSTERRYILRVAPEHQTVHAARAASFGMTPEQFRPTIET